MTGIERLRRVGTHVSVAAATPRTGRKRLKRAAAEFDAAWRADGPDWPLRFRLKADVIRALLTRHGGTDETVDRLPGGDVAEATAALRTFCEEAERAVARTS